MYGFHKTWVVRCWHGYLSGTRRTCIWLSWCHCHSLSLASVKSRFTFLVPAYPGSPGKGAVKRVCVCVCMAFIFKLHSLQYYQPRLSLRAAAVGVVLWAVASVVPNCWKTVSVIAIQLQWLSDVIELQYAKLNRMQRKQTTTTTTTV